MNISRGFGGQEERFNYIKLGSTGWFGPNSCVQSKRCPSHFRDSSGNKSNASLCKNSFSAMLDSLRSGRIHYITHVAGTNLPYILKPLLFLVFSIIWAVLHWSEGCTGDSVKQYVTYVLLHTLLSYFYCQMVNRTHTHTETNTYGRFYNCRYIWSKAIFSPAFFQMVIFKLFYSFVVSVKRKCWNSWKSWILELVSKVQ